MLSVQANTESLLRLIVPYLSSVDLSMPRKPLKNTLLLGMPINPFNILIILVWMPR